VGEFERSLEKVGVDLTARDLVGISERLDSNGDGRVSSEELRELVECRGDFSRLEEEASAAPEFADEQESPSRPTSRYTKHGEGDRD